MPGKEQVLRLLERGHGYAEIAGILDVTPGLAYLIATGVPADGGGTVTAGQRRRPGLLPSRTQRLVNPRELNPTSHDEAHAWLRRRALDDAQMQAAAAERSRA